ncbi:unnamed protein product [Durusdinium trenchii]|uniref:BRCT domain-containing protein n=2 Tax=Durusdinium trenchii TaxID=1381693 RepID=A0ABP0SBB5_9DINO
MKRSASDALVATAEPKSGQQLRLPLLLFLSPRIPVDQAADVRVLVASKPQYASLSDSEEGALLVLPDFQQEEVAALEKRKKRVVGLPFVQRFLQDPGLLSKVPALPLFDLIYRCPGALCFSAMEPRQRARSQSLAKWMGARYTQDAGPGTELLVAARVSIHPDSKYQEALARRIPIVKPSYLEAVWEAKHLVDVQAHHLLPLAGLAICFDADCSGDGEGLKNGAIASGAQVMPFDQAEVVIVSDTSRPLYKEARRRGQQVAPPKWLERCLQIRCTLQISGDLEVPQPGIVCGNSPASVEAQTTMVLASSVLCLLYLDPGSRESARAWAWRCGAWTTLNAFDAAITHVLFNVLPGTSVQVSVPVDKDIYFLDVSWLEACASGKRASEGDFPRQQVVYNPASDMQNGMKENSRGLRKVRSTGAEDLPLMRPAPAPLADAEPHITLASSEGIFGGMVLGILGWNPGEEAKLVDRICKNGGSALHGIGNNINGLKTRRIDMCVCPNGPAPSDAGSVVLVTTQWLEACISEKAIHSSSDFPHFEPAKHPLPLSSMSNFVIRITGLEQDRKSTRERWRLEELVKVLGAKVAQQSTRKSELTHIVCAEASLLEARLAEMATKRQVPLVSVQWLLDCFRYGEHQKEDKYTISTSSGSTSASNEAAATCFTAVLNKCDILLSNSTLSVEPDLLRMAKELAAARVQTWKSIDELRTLLRSPHGNQAVIVVDKDEARRERLERLLDGGGTKLEHSFVQPSWLSETYSQRRRLPLESFAVFTAESTQEPRPTQGASYAWQPAELKRLEEVSEQSRREMESKGLSRLAKLGS